MRAPLEGVLVDRGSEMESRMRRVQKVRASDNGAGVPAPGGVLDSDAITMLAKPGGFCFAAARRLGVPKGSTLERFLCDGCGEKCPKEKERPTIDSSEEGFAIALNQDVNDRPFYIWEYGLRCL